MTWATVMRQNPESRDVQLSEVCSTGRAVTRVILIDDHARQGLKSLLEDHVAIIGLSVDRSKSQALKEPGAVACLSKESAADELFNVIQRIMAARKARTEDHR